jgi:hypothetical protein
MGHPVSIPGPTPPSGRATASTSAMRLAPSPSGSLPR